MHKNTNASMRRTVHAEGRWDELMSYWLQDKFPLRDTKVKVEVELMLSQLTSEA